MDQGAASPLCPPPSCPLLSSCRHQAPRAGSHGSIGDAQPRPGGCWTPQARVWGKEICRVFGQKGSFVFGFLNDAFHMALHHAQLLHHFSQEI